ncbi:hypothetical protein AwErysi_06870 [Erysipelotrichaceae bacterium]|nr:hypothetical protein AwErysi_06870 [Erysipelotrichaceae bacterium]
MKRFLDYITLDARGIKIWSIVFGLTGTIFAIILGILFYSPEQSFIQNIVPSISVPIGFLCVYYLGLRKNIGNILGFIANILEFIVNTAFGNFGFYISTIYYGLSHVFGYIDWNKNLDADNKIKVRDLSNKRDLFILVIMLIFSTIFVFIAKIIGLLPFEVTSFAFIGNILVMYLGIVAQGTMMLRYRYAWFIWIAMNCFAIPIQFLTGNYVYGMMYCFYQLNAFICLYAQYHTRVEK